MPEVGDYHLTNLTVVLEPGQPQAHYRSASYLEQVETLVEGVLQYGLTEDDLVPELYGAIELLIEATVNRIEYVTEAAGVDPGRYWTLQGFKLLDAHQTVSATLENFENEFDRHQARTPV